jgi:RNA 2',3'-cyclic 3'-phosphodiesterase
VHQPTGGDGHPRLFVAVWPPAHVRDAMAELPRPVEPGVTWEPPERLHITLRFLGRTDPGAVTEALAGLDGERVGDGDGGVEAVLGPVVSRLGRSVVCVPVAGLDALAAAVASRTADLGEPPDPRGFTGHLTLARLRHRAACGVAGHRFTARFGVDRVALVVSERDRNVEGSASGVLHYRTLAEIPINAT